MVDRDPYHQRRYPGGKEGEELSFDDAEFSQRLHRITQLNMAHNLLRAAYRLDQLFSAAHESGDPIGPPLTKKFVSRSGGNLTYPFPHERIKLKPKNRTRSDMSVAAMRFPVSLGASKPLDKDRLYIAWEVDGEDQAFILTPASFSGLVLAAAFREPDSSGEWPSRNAMVPADELAHFRLAQLLDHEGFEPDLQPHDPDLVA